LNLHQYIDGQICEAQGPLQTHVGPWDQNILAQWNSAEEMEVIRSLQSAKKFLAKPVSWPRQERIELLKNIKQVVLQNSESWALLEATHQGLPYNFVLENGFRHVEEILNKNILDVESFNSSSKILSPTGVIAVITASPLSFRLVMESLVPALAAGNAVIVKVSSKSPITAQILQQMAKQSEIPQGSLHVLLGEGSRVGSFLASHPGVRGVSFVGKTRTVENVIKVTASQFKKLHLRGSAKNSAIVLPGFTKEQIPELLESFLMADGKTGWSMSKLLTTESEAPGLMEMLKDYLKNLKTAKTPKESHPWRGITELSKFSELKSKAIEEHGKLLVDENNLPSFLVDLPNCSDLQQDELGVPIFPIVTVKYQHEFAKWANNTSFGNLATIWGDPDKASKVAEKIEVGSVWINHWMRRQDESPWGIKQSAFGIPDQRATGAFFSDCKLTQ
jgi:aminomuconate-semialdehyde/2-hydroxymuconate-6-semialdehyde dehydrogenase